MPDSPGTDTRSCPVVSHPSADFLDHDLAARFETHPGSADGFGRLWAISEPRGCANADFAAVCQKNLRGPAPDADDVGPPGAQVQFRLEGQRGARTAGGSDPPPRRNQRRGSGDDASGRSARRRRRAEGGARRPGTLRAAGAPPRTAERDQLVDRVRARNYLSHPGGAHRTKTRSAPTTFETWETDMRAFLRPLPPACG